MAHLLFDYEYLLMMSTMTKMMITMMIVCWCCDIDGGQQSEVELC